MRSLLSYLVARLTVFTIAVVPAFVHADQSTVAQIGNTTQSASVNLTAIPIPPLMKAAFGNSYRERTQDAVVALSDIDNRSLRQRYVVQPIDARLIDQEQAVLVLNGQIADRHDEVFSSHAQAGLLTIIFFKRHNEQWQVVKRQENIAALGSFGSIGDVTWTKLGQTTPGLLVLHGNTGQGYSFTQLAIFDLTAPQTADLSGEPILIHLDNDGMCDRQRHDCWDVSANWQFVSTNKNKSHDDLILSFSGFKPASEKNPTRTIEVKQTARYTFDGKSYRLIQGNNPVPPV